MMHNGVPGYMRSMTKRYYLRDRCTIEVEQTTRDANFLNVTSWASVADDLACRLLPAGQGDTERVEAFGAQESIKVIKRLIVPHDTALDVGQRVTIGSEVYYVAALDVANTDEVFRAAVVVQMAGADNG
ncbi:MAG: phage head completion protein [Anaerolineae bacterium]